MVLYCTILYYTVPDEGGQLLLQPGVAEEALAQLAQPRQVGLVAGQLQHLARAGHRQLLRQTPGD